jgi:hypothetical protein
VPVVAGLKGKSGLDSGTGSSGGRQRKRPPQQQQQQHSNIKANNSTCNSSRTTAVAHPAGLSASGTAQPQDA